MPTYFHFTFPSQRSQKIEILLNIKEFRNLFAKFEPFELSIFSMIGNYDQISMFWKKKSCVTVMQKKSCEKKIELKVDYTYAADGSEMSNF